jgi:EAL domain-containing protein (putative c-di-GMP-specific phosphodiesterase class I)
LRTKKLVGVIALANAFELQTVAEGIETDEHFQTLRNIGCEVGHLRPMPANELSDWLVRFQPKLI